MDEERAHDIALRIRDEFEDLLDEKNITIPSADREGVQGEARLYGEENSRLVEAIFEFLMEQPDTKFAAVGVEDARHPVRRLAIRICDEFEEPLAKKDIKISSGDRTGAPEEACLWGSEYYALEDTLVGILMEEFIADSTGNQAASIGEDARVAVEAIQKRMTEAPEGLVTLGSATAHAEDTPARTERRRGPTAPLR